MEFGEHFIADRGAAPNSIEDLLLQNDLADVLEEMDQHPHRARRNSNLLASHHDGIERRSDEPVTDLNVAVHE